MSGLSQMHVEVTVERVKRRFGVEIDHAPAARAVLRGDPQGGARARPLQEADRRPRPVRRLPHRGRAAAGARGLRVRRQDRRRRHPAELPARRRQGHPGDDAHGRARGLPGDRRARHARRRLVPLRRLVGDGFQDRRLDGVQGGLREGRPRAARADHGRRDHVPDGLGRRRHRRPQLAPRAAARHGAGRPEPP